jgi:hypothetical protein
MHLRQGIQLIHLGVQSTAAGEGGALTLGLGAFQRTVKVVRWIAGLDCWTAGLDCRLRAGLLV